MNDNANVAQRMNQSITAYWRGYGESEGRIFEKTDDDWILWSGIPHPVINIVFVERSTPERMQDLLRRSRNLIDEGGIGLSWWLSPQALAERADQALKDAGLEFEGMAPAMACDLGNFAPLEPPPGLHIETVSGSAARADWGDLAARGFEFDAAQTTAMSAAEHDIPADLM